MKTLPRLGLIVLLAILVGVGSGVLLTPEAAQSQRRTRAECYARYRADLESIRRGKTRSSIRHLQRSIARSQRSLGRDLSPSQRMRVHARLQRDRAELERLSIAYYNDLMRAQARRDRCLSRARF